MHTALKYCSILLLFGLLATGCDDKKKESNGEAEAENGDNTEQTDNGEAVSIEDKIDAVATHFCDCFEPFAEVAKKVQAGELERTAPEVKAAQQELQTCAEKIEQMFPEFADSDEYKEPVLRLAREKCPEAMKVAD